MQILNPEVDIEHFYRRLKEANRKVLFLDYDGTLAPFREDPDKAYPYPGVRKVLNLLMEKDEVYLCIISGRWIKDLIPLLNLEKQPEIWGSHGLERLLPDGLYETAPMEKFALKGLADGQYFLSSIGLSERCELKPGCVAVHWRGLDDKDIQEVKSKVEPEWLKIANEHKLELRQFDGGLEIRVPGRDKGNAVETVLSGFEDSYIASYLGDDLTDEDAFRSLKGRGLGALVRKELRETAADIWLIPPEEMINFLSKWL
jgi:trehalose 6-phosphate phosphatase